MSEQSEKFRKHPDSTCLTCKRIQTKSDDTTTINAFGLCRICQKEKSVPLPWKTFKDGKLVYGCYFPSTDLNVSEMGGRGTGKPHDVIWIEHEEKSH